MGVDFYSTLGGPLIEAPKAPRSNAEGVRIEDGVGCGEGVSPSPLGEGSGSAPSPENVSIADLKMVRFYAFFVVCLSLDRSDNT